MEPYTPSSGSNEISARARWHCKRWGFERPYWLDWIEPAHLTPEGWGEVSVTSKREPSKQPDPHPDPWREKVMVTVVDEVYPELGIKDRIASARETLLRRVRHEVVEPAHFRDLVRRISPEILEELVAVLERHGGKSYAEG